MQENYYQSVAPFFHLEHKVKEKTVVNCGHRYFKGGGSTQERKLALGRGLRLLPRGPWWGLRLFTDLFSPSDFKKF